MTGSKDILCEMGMSVDQEHSKSLILKVPIFFFLAVNFQWNLCTYIGKQFQIQSASQEDNNFAIETLGF